MALPTRPTGEHSSPKARPVIRQSESITLPDLDEPVTLQVPEEVPEHKLEPVRRVKPRIESTQSKASSKPRPAEKPKQKLKPAAEVPRNEDSLPEGWAIDKKTGKKYRKLPKSQWDAEGIPVLQVDSFNLDNLTGEAEIFLAHLRVAPDKEEQKRLRELKAKMTRDSNAKYAKENSDEDEAEIE